MKTIVPFLCVIAIIGGIWVFVTALKSLANPADRQPDWAEQSRLLSFGEQRVYLDAYMHPDGVVGSLKLQDGTIRRVKVKMVETWDDPALTQPSNAPRLDAYAK